ncbi:hypothetical protein ONA91_25395 [Micromonospora sp. DR5-3]|uniref:hypothetical protein n=1 Tax=Micromonospora sp. DR5-3 TaxID=2992129 RepID=UPI00222F4615|nr:hypothetical protein [Micromonospora sp. DR5-3]MCW3817790.1 hypothetical protein [Micromonospora sp. DR5-3]
MTTAAVLGLIVTTIAGATPANASPATATTETFIGYGYLPENAHQDALAQMHAYSPSCYEVSTTYSPAGSMHYWKATLTAEC